MDEASDPGHAAGRATVNSLWLGERLGPISAACLASFVRHGHRVVLHCYNRPRDVPQGVEVADAGEVVPRSRIMRHRVSGSYALFSDLFRYELLRQNRGLWIDCDVYCLRPFDFAGGHVYGWESADSICGAVLGLPPGSPVLASLLALFEQPSPIPPWLPEQTQRELQAAKDSGARFDMSHLPWGAAGPLALTYLLRSNHLAERAMPPAVFYPLPHEQAPALSSAGFDIASVVTGETRAIHLWNQTVSRNTRTIERYSPMDRLLSQGTLLDEGRIASLAGAAAR